MTTSNVYCRNCKYGNVEKKFCGLGLKLINGECSKYVSGTAATPALPTPYKPKGSFIPVHTVETYRYRLVVYSNNENPSNQSLYKLARYLNQHQEVLTAIRYQCHFKRDYYGNLYPHTHSSSWGSPHNVCRRSARCGIALDVIKCSRQEMRIYWALTRDADKHVYTPSSSIWTGPYDPDIPPHYWWLDITAPVEHLIPMHNLIRAVCTASIKEPHGYLTLGMVLRRALILGLKYRGRPLDEWAQAILELGVTMYQKGTVPVGSKRVYHRKGYPKRLLREWCILNALEGY